MAAITDFAFNVYNNGEQIVKISVLNANLSLPLLFTKTKMVKTKRLFWKKEIKVKWFVKYALMILLVIKIMKYVFVVMINLFTKDHAWIDTGEFQELISNLFAEIVHMKLNSNLVHLHQALDHHQYKILI